MLLSSTKVLVSPASGRGDEAGSLSGSAFIFYVEPRRTMPAALTRRSTTCGDAEVVGSRIWHAAPNGKCCHQNDLCLCVYHNPLFILSTLANVDPPAASNGTVFGLTIRIVRSGGREQLLMALLPNTALS